MTQKYYRKRFFNERICFVCRRHVPEGQAVYHSDLRILAHRDECSNKVDAVRRVHDRSRRGRWRPKREVLALLEEARQCTA